MSDNPNNPPKKSFKKTICSINASKRVCDSLLAEKYRALEKKYSKTHIVIPTNCSTDYIDGQYIHIIDYTIIEL